MCIISKEVNSVSKTNILVAVDKSNTRQLIIYSNNVDNKTVNNAMILPVPNPTTIKFHNLSNYTTIFDDCDKMVNNVKTLSTYGIKATMNYYDQNTLKVYNVGSYKVSIANSLNELKKVNRQVFDLGYGCEELLSKNYNNPIYGFIICKLDMNNKNYHPFGYSHKIHNNQIFIPTKHYHEHYQEYSSFGSSLGYSSILNENSVDEGWDHNIYLYNTSGFTNSPIKTDYVWNNKNYINIQNIDFPFGQLNNFEKYNIKGNFPNIDLITIPLPINNQTYNNLEEKKSDETLSCETPSCIIM